MKKLFSLLSAIALVVTLAACETTVEYVDVFVETIVEVEVPVEVIKEVIVEVPVEVIKEVPVEVIIVEEVIVEVAADVQNERFYKPGVYFNHTEMSTDGVYTTVVVVVDAYGEIVGVSFDDTTTVSKFKIDADDQLYVYVPGDKVSVPNTYRLLAGQTSLDYPTFADAITAEDLVEGVHNAAIAELADIETFETSRVLKEAWVTEADLLGAAIIADQTTYGIQTMVSGAAVTTVNVADVDLTNVDVLIGLVQSILDGEAMLTEETVLATTPVMGLYTPGMYYGDTDRVIGSSNYYYNAFVAVDQYGRIAGVFTDATVGGAADDEKATKWILGEEGYPLPGGWHNQAIAYGEAIVVNQGLEGFVFTDHDIDDREYADQVAGTTIHVEGINIAIAEAIALATDWDNQQGTYYVVSGETFMFATINADGEIENLVIDQVRSEDQATIVIDGDVFMLYTYEQQKVVAEELVERTLLVYKDGEDYRSVYDVLRDGYSESLDIEDAVSFDLDTDLGIDEMATLEIVAGNYTKQVLGAAYGAGTLTTPWNVQTQAFASVFLGETSPYVINLTDGRHTDVTGVTIKVEKYQQMLVDLLLVAQDSDDAYAAYVVEVTPSTPVADGMYFASLTPKTNGNQAVAYMTVVDNTITDLVFDVTTVSAGTLTTFNALGDAQFVAKDETKDGEDDYYEVAPLEAASILAVQSGIIAEIEAGFDYKTDGDYGVMTSGIWGSAGLDLEGTDYATLTEMLVQEALLARVQEIADAAGVSFMENKKVELASGEQKANHMAAGDFEIAGALVKFGVSYDPINDDVLDIDSAGDLEAQEVSSNTTGTVMMTLDFDGIDYVYEVTYPIHTASSLNTADLAVHYKTGLDGLEILEGVTKVLTDITGFKMDNAGARVSTTGLWWTNYDTVTASSGLGLDLGGLVAGTHVITYSLEYETGLLVTRDYTVVVVSEADAVADALAGLSAGIILDNGEFTAQTVNLPKVTSIEGITFNWAVDVDSSGVADMNDASGILTLDRMYTSQKVILTATVKADTVAKETQQFEFRIVAETNAGVEARMVKEVKANLDTAINYLDIALSGLVPNTSGLIMSTDFALDTTAVVSYALEFTHAANSGLITINSTNGELTIVANNGTIAGTTEEVVTVVVTISVNTDEDPEAQKDEEVLFTEEYSFIIFKN